MPPRPLRLQCAFGDPVFLLVEQEVQMRVARFVSFNYEEVFEAMPLLSEPFPVSLNFSDHERSHECEPDIAFRIVPPWAVLQRRRQPSEIGQVLMRLWSERQGPEPSSEPCLQAELGLVYGCVRPVPLARSQTWAAPPASNITADEKPVTSMVREPQWRQTVAVIVNGPLGRTMFRCPILTQRVINLPRQNLPV